MQINLSSQKELKVTYCKFFRGRNPDPPLNKGAASNVARGTAASNAAA